MQRYQILTVLIITTSVVQNVDKDHSFPSEPFQLKAGDVMLLGIDYGTLQVSVLGVNHVASV